MSRQRQRQQLIKILLGEEQIKNVETTFSSDLCVKILAALEAIDRRTIANNTKSSVFAALVRKHFQHVYVDELNKWNIDLLSLNVYDFVDECGEYSNVIDNGDVKMAIKAFVKMVYQVEI